MHPRKTVDRVLSLCRPGVTTREIARLTGIPESTISHWRRGDRRSKPDKTSACPRCCDVALPDSYAYLLGAYLGDGHITTGRRGVQALSLYCADAWPGVMSETEKSMHTALGTSVFRVQKPGCVEVKACSKHWGCLFPQHGSGMKHTRPIVLEPWQREVVDEQAGKFLRGLIHADGCRITNWTQRYVAGELKRYTYPRYSFSNKSFDVLDLCAAALNRLSISHTRPRWDMISVARRAAVAKLDEHVGPKS